jgi:hypothetical protein
MPIAYPTISGKATPHALRNARFAEILLLSNLVSTRQKDCVVLSGCLVATVIAAPEIAVAARISREDCADVAGGGISGAISAFRIVETRETKKFIPAAKLAVPEYPRLSSK